MKKLLICLLVFPMFSLQGQHDVAFLESIHARPDRLSKMIKVEGKVPFELVNGLIIVNARLNGEEGAFILDTGAPALVLNDRSGEAGQLSGEGVNGQVELGEVNVEDFELGTVRRKRIDAYTLDISHLGEATNRQIDGLIGFEVFRESEMLFDYGHEQIQFFPARNSSLHKFNRPLLAVELEMHEHLPVLVLRAGEQTIRLGIDTGTEINLVDRSLIPLLEGQLQWKEEYARVRGLNQQATMAQKAVVTLTLPGAEHSRPVECYFADLSATPSVRDLKIDGLVGFEFLRQMRFSINFPEKQFYVW